MIPKSAPSNIGAKEKGFEYAAKSPRCRPARGAKLAGCSFSRRIPALWRPQGLAEEVGGPFSVGLAVTFSEKSAGEAGYDFSLYDRGVRVCAPCGVSAKSPPSNGGLMTFRGEKRKLPGDGVCGPRPSCRSRRPRE
jgi:hypothetical protein